MRLEYLGSVSPGYTSASSSLDSQGNQTTIYYYPDGHTETGIIAAQPAQSAYARASGQAAAAAAQAKNAQQAAQAAAQGAVDAATAGDLQKANDLYSQAQALLNSSKNFSSQATTFAQNAGKLAPAAIAEKNAQTTQKLNPWLLIIPGGIIAILLIRKS